MTKALISREFVHDIADAIREKRGTSEGTDTDVVLSIFAASVEQVDESTAIVSITDASGTTRATLHPSLSGVALTYDDITRLTPYGDIPDAHAIPPLVDDVGF